MIYINLEVKIDSKKYQEIFNEKLLPSLKVKARQNGDWLSQAVNTLCCKATTLWIRDKRNLNSMKWDVQQRNQVKEKLENYRNSTTFLCWYMKSDFKNKRELL